MAAVSARSLRAKLQHAERAANGARELSNVLTTELGELREKLKKAVAERDTNERLYNGAYVARDAASKQRDEARKEIESLQQQLATTQWTLRGAENERDQARAHADAMRHRAFPTPPEFPWEVPVTTERAYHDGVRRY